MYNTYAYRNAICPYFDHDADKSITCEGVYDNTRLAVKFASEEKKIAHIKGFCCTYSFSRCKIAKLIESKIGEEQDNDTQ